jgi:polar amino acid transport system substrate-binding protein
LNRELVRLQFCPKKGRKASENLSSIHHRKYRRENKHEMPNTLVAPLLRIPRSAFRVSYTSLICLLLLPLVARAQAPLRWGGDKAGGAPFIYEEAGKGEVGFEVELAKYLGEKLGRKPELVQCDWDSIPGTLERGDIDIALNGLEYIPGREKDFPSTVPYFVFTLRLIVAKGNEDIRTWDDLRHPKNGQKYRVGVLRGSFAHRYLEKVFGDDIDLKTPKEVDETFQLVEDGERMDATVQDSPAAAYYVFGGHRPKLKVVGPPAGTGYYVILTRPADQQLRTQLNEAIKIGLADGTLEKIYRKYDLWDSDQERVAYAHLRPWPPIELTPPGEEAKSTDKISITSLGNKLAWATFYTVALAVCSMPLAMLIGLGVAVARMYGPRWLKWIFDAYVEVLRGTPLLLQMYVWFFLVPQMAHFIGWEPLVTLVTLPPFVVGVFGLAINYSANEAENYRAGLQAIPKGQMEAALALGMTPGMAIRRILIPQAVRIVIPPVTNDFIALFKDTSICSMILITELTGLYYQYKFDRDLVLQLAFVIGLIYLLISYPLSLLANYLERRLSGSRESK